MKKMVIVMLMLLSTTQAQSNNLIIDGAISGGLGKIQIEEPRFFYGNGICIKFLGFVAKGVFVVVPSCEKGMQEHYYNVSDLPILITPENTKKSYLISYVDTNLITIQLSDAAIDKTINEFKERDIKKENERKEWAKKKQEKVNELIERAKLAPMGSLEKDMLLNEAELLNRQRR